MTKSEFESMVWNLKSFKVNVEELAKYYARSVSNPDSKWIFHFDTGNTAVARNSVRIAQFRDIHMDQNESILHINRDYRFNEAIDCVIEVIELAIRTRWPNQQDQHDEVSGS